MPPFQVTRPGTPAMGLFVEASDDSGAHPAHIEPVSAHRSDRSVLVAVHILETTTVSVEPGMPYSDEQIAAVFIQWYRRHSASDDDADALKVDVPYPRGNEEFELTEASPGLVLRG